MHSLIEDEQNPNYLAMYQDEIQRLNALDESDVDPIIEAFVVGEEDPANLIGAQMVDYEPEEFPADLEKIPDDSRLLEL